MEALRLIVNEADFCPERFDGDAFRSADRRLGVAGYAWSVGPGLSSTTKPATPEISIAAP